LHHAGEDGVEGEEDLAFSGEAFFGEFVEERLLLEAGLPWVRYAFCIEGQNDFKDLRGGVQELDQT
jgi:hypothetical protein